MAAKQKGGGPKKRVSQRQQSLDQLRYHAPPATLGGPVATSSNAQRVTNSSETMSPSPSESFMRSRREHTFASLVGQAVTVHTLDGSILSGILTTSGNSSVLPNIWSNSNCPMIEEVPAPEATYIYSPPQGGAARSVTGATDNEDGGWRVVNKQKRRGGGGTTASSSGRRTDGEDSQASGNSGSAAAESSSCFELLYSEQRATNASNKAKPSCLWLRCAYKQPSTTQRSSMIFDWLAIPWEEIDFLRAEEVPDDPDAMTNQRQRPGFQTDAEISQTARSVQGRQLQKWAETDDVEAELGSGLSGSREKDTSWPLTIQEGSEDRGWDQFKVNEDKFGVTSTYIDGMYSTVLNEEVIPDDYKKHADRLAEEMDAQRKHRPRDGGRYQYRSDESDDDNDDEIKYSAVVTTAPRYGPSQAAKPVNRAAAASLREEMRQTSNYSRKSLGKGNMSRVPPNANDPRIMDPKGRPVVTRPETMKRQSSSYALNGSNQAVSDIPAVVAANHVPPSTQTGQVHLRPSVVGGQQQVPKKREGAPAPSGEGNATESATKNVKDNINALNLEPIKSRRISPPTKKKGAPLLPTTSAAAASDVQKKRLEKKEEFLRSARLIESNLAKKGWSDCLNGTDKESIPPVRQEGPFHHHHHGGDEGLAPSTGTATKDGERPATAQDRNNEEWRPEAQDFQPRPDDIDPSPDDASSFSKRQFFQFNPNATTFTPKEPNYVDAHPVTTSPLPQPPLPSAGPVNAPTSTPAPPPLPPPSPPPPAPSALPTKSGLPPSDMHHQNAIRINPLHHQASTPPLVKHANLNFKSFDPVVAELRRRARHALEKTCPAGDTEVMFVPNFYDTFVEAAREGTMNQSPSQVHPDWENKYNISYTDLLQPTTYLTTAATAAMMPTPFGFGPGQPPHFYLPPPGGPLTVTGMALNPGAPPFTHVAASTPPYFNFPIMARPASMIATAASPTLDPQQLQTAFHPIIIPQQAARWPAPAGGAGGETNSVAAAPWPTAAAIMPGPYPQEFIATSNGYGLVACQRMPMNGSAYPMNTR